MKNDKKQNEESNYKPYLGELTYSEGGRFERKALSSFIIENIVVPDDIHFNFGVSILSDIFSINNNEITMHEVKNSVDNDYFVRTEGINSIKKRINTFSDEVKRMIIDKNVIHNNKKVKEFYGDIKFKYIGNATKGGLDKQIKDYFGDDYWIIKDFLGEILGSLTNLFLEYIKEKLKTQRYITLTDLEYIPIINFHKIINNIDIWFINDKEINITFSRSVKEQYIARQFNIMIFALGLSSEKAKDIIKNADLEEEFVNNLINFIERMEKNEDL